MPGREVNVPQGITTPGGSENKEAAFIGYCTSLPLATRPLAKTEQSRQKRPVSILTE